MLACDYCNLIADTIGKKQDCSKCPYIPINRELRQITVSEVCKKCGLKPDSAACWGNEDCPYN